jgi:hypothetical protein
LRFPQWRFTSFFCLPTPVRIVCHRHFENLLHM